jgi:glycosyltransferase domain-containing protein
MNCDTDNEERMITLLVPTMNRSDFLIRLLRYYNEIHFKGCICIGDSSNPEHIEKTKKEIETLKGKLNIVYQEYPDLKATECLNLLIDLVSSPYAVLLADDDFLVPSALNKCVMFLERNRDYAAARGLGIAIELGYYGAYGPVVKCNLNRKHPQEAESASQRLVDHMSNYTVILLAVHRIESLRAIFRDLHSLKDNPFGELLSCCISVILGKSKELDCLFLVSQDHAQRYLNPDMYDWITSPVWYPSYLVFRDSLVEFLTLQDTISIVEAQKVVKQAFWAYLVMFLSRQYPEGPQPRWRQVAATIPGARCMWQFLHSMRPKKHSVFSLPALLKQSSPYHADFMPVYKALTTPPTEFSDKPAGK